MKEILQNKLAIPLLALAIVGVGGSAYTLSHVGPMTVSAQTTTAADKPDVAGDQKDPSYTSSIRVNDTQEVSDSTEAKQLASLAKISEGQAKAAAEKGAGGTASSVELENENGNVVYAVTVGNKEVKVDAGNGAILHTETADSADKGAKSE